MNILGIHHITAIAGDPQTNVDFYAGVLGLRLVKLTVNFDDPGTYHLYYGDGVGSPGTIITFFPWPKAPRGRRGTGQVTASAFAIPSGAVAYWEERLAGHGIAFIREAPRFGESVLSFKDPDGMGVELIAGAEVPDGRIYTDGGVPAPYAIRGIHSATLAEEAYQKTAALLQETMGFRPVGQEGNRFRYASGSAPDGAIADVLCAPEWGRGTVLVGNVHHIAWRTPDEAAQQECLDALERLSYNVSPVMDRKYFQSIYYREPGGILFEIATDPPGFTVDEPLEQLGTRLVLPAWLEERREEVEAALPALRLPASVGSRS